MFFRMPVDLYEEKECVTSHAAELARLGKKALIVTGRRSAKVSGALADVQEALRREETDYVVFDEVEENPSVETVMKARDLAIDEEIDFVIGIGGGSPLDAAKAIAFMAYHRDQEAGYLYESPEDERAFPVAAVPTTCGTGSEVTAVAVLTRHEMRTKASMSHKIFPRLALVDAKYLEYAPKAVLCSTAVDALAHLMESAVNTRATAYSRMFVREGLRTWARTREVLTGERAASGEDYRDLMNASTFAGMAIAHTGTSLPHGLSYHVTYELGMAHGKACGYFLAGYLREAPLLQQREWLPEAGFADVCELEDFLKCVCGSDPLPQKILEETVAQIASNEAKLANCPYPADESVLRRIAGLSA